MKLSNAILIIGANSSIAKGIAHAFAKKGQDIILISRDSDNLTRLSKDIEIRFDVKCLAFGLDITDSINHQNLWNRLYQEHVIQGVVYAAGYMAKPNTLVSHEDIQRIIDVNYSAAVSFLEKVAISFSEKKKGFIIGISSISGDRGRQSNYIYGSAKAGFTAYLQGLRQRLSKDGIHVLTIKPGFVDTAMTFGLKGLFLVADPMVIGKAIVNALEKKKNCCYLPWFWRYIMLIIIHIPEIIFKRLKL